jgi:hypothetical protein
MWTPDRVEQMIEDKKNLRRIYEFLEEYGNFNMDYEGGGTDGAGLGDTVSIRPRPDIAKGIEGYRNLAITISLPKKNTLQYIMNRVDWELEGDIVIVCNGGNFSMGYCKV